MTKGSSPYSSLPCLDLLLFVKECGLIYFLLTYLILYCDLLPFVIDYLFSDLLIFWTYFLLSFTPTYFDGLTFFCYLKILLQSNKCSKKKLNILFLQEKDASDSLVRTS